MIVIPAIDIMGGKAVRLVRGARESATVFSDEPQALADELCAGGAERLHVVDLDGAFAGAPVSRLFIERILGSAKVPVQVGGGLRDRATVESALASGARWAVLGTAAVRSPDLVSELCRAFPDRIIVAVDAVHGMVAVEGWTEASSISAVDLGTRAATWGAAALLYTDVARDGTGSGPAVDSTAALAEAVPIPVIASGGVGALDDLRALSAAKIPMVVVGRALLERRFTLEEAIEAAR
ncbi:MAG TPA: 1-(5-phosphoribosyl)-5-[(5-phosphoribosylamino)methylideneamino]imidazole-4-carboxamide isomerase [Kofleriaceae bacterium]